MLRYITATLILLAALTGTAGADTFDCDNCTDCNAKIQSASAGDVVRLTADITDCDGDCIEFNGTDGVTFDGGGHVIDGTGQAGDTGLYLGANSNDNTIKNCTICEFYTGIKIADSQNNTITDMVSEDNWYANIHLRYADHNNLTNVSARDTKPQSSMGGFYLQHSDYNNFTDIVSSNNTKYGIYIYQDSNHNIFRNATITTNEGQGGLYAHSLSSQSTTNDIDTSNTINGKPIQFFDGYYNACPNDQVLDYNDTYSLIHFYNCNNITLYATTLEDSLFLWSTHNSKIYAVNASHGMEGIRVWQSSSNTFTNITTSHNANSGFYARYSYHNNFINITSSYNNKGFDLWNLDYNVFANVIASNNGDDGFYIRYGDYNTFNNVTASNNGDDGIMFEWGADHNTVNNSHIEHNSGAGLYFYGSTADDNLIYNNYFNNTNNFDSDGTVNPNDWNISKRSGTNIISGSWLGGNYWATPTSTGFSETCMDADGDGLCDAPYILTTNNTDHLPLTKSKAPPRTIYVPDDYETIQWAVDNATAGDTIIVHDRTYNENVDIIKQLTIRSANGSANCIVNASTPNDHVFGVTANYVNISGFTVTGATGNWIAGIYLNTVSHCNISNNNASNNRCGIYLCPSCDHNTLMNNNASNNQYGIYLTSSSNNTLTKSTATGNSYYGIYLTFSSNDNTLTDNIALNNSRDGISLSSSSNSNNLTGNTVNSNGEDGIHLQSSTDNHLRGNIVSDNNYYGIYLQSTNNNNLTSNIMSENNYNFGIAGYSHSYFIHDIDETNTVNEKPIYYWVDRRDDQVPCNAGFVGIVNSTNITVKDVTLTDNGVGVLFVNTSNSRIETAASSENEYGIYLLYSNYNNLSGNIVSDNNGFGIHLLYSDNNNLTGNTINENAWDGIYIESSSDNTLADNTALNNDYGITLDSSSNNPIYNNLVRNTRGDIRNTYDSHSNIFTNNTLLSYHPTVTTFTCSGDVLIKGVDSPPDDPDGWLNVSRYVDATIYSGAWLQLDVSYNDSDVVGDESTLLMWKHDDGGWGLASDDTGVNTEENYVYANITATDQGMFAPLVNAGGVIPTPSVHNINTTEDFYTIQEAIDAENTADGHIIEVGDGVYQENVDVPKRLNIHSENGSSLTTVQASNPEDHVFEVTVDYVNISGFTITNAIDPQTAGIYLGDNVDHCNISDNNVSNNRYGIYLSSSDNNTLSNNTANSNNDSGIHVESSSNNLIYNNYFNNPNNACDDGTNVWNVTNTTGPNIIGGPYIGGNYWSDYTGVDSDGDGFGDTPHNITTDGSNQDHLPLVRGMCGDIDGSGTVNILDVRLLMNHVANPTWYPVDSNAGNVDGIGGIDSADVQLLLLHVFDPAGHSLNCPT